MYSKTYKIFKQYAIQQRKTRNKNATQKGLAQSLKEYKAKLKLKGL